MEIHQRNIITAILVCDCVMGLFGFQVDAKQPEETTEDHKLDEIFKSKQEENIVTLNREGSGNNSTNSWSSWFQSTPPSSSSNQFDDKKVEEPSSGEERNDGNRTQTSFEENPDSNSNKTNGQEEGWGYDLYPERKGETYKPRWSRVLFGLEGTENLDKIKCERNVYWCVKNSPLVKLMMGAMKSSGCPVDIRRHISCEVCDPSVTGGYDPVLNQIVVCQNMARRKGFVQGVLTHEMIHMFDYCNNELDFRNIDHLACTEIRAANLAHCSFLSACAQGDASVINIRKTHENCVKSKALASVLAVRNVTRQEAINAVERVFPKCYNDLEPIGRRLKRNSQDAYRAYMEGPMYGYDV